MERAVGKYARPALAKRKRNRAVCPEYQITRGGESPGEREHQEKKVDSIVKEGRFQGRQGGASKKKLLRSKRHLYQHIFLNGDLISSQLSSA